MLRTWADMTTTYNVICISYLRFRLSVFVYDLQVFGNFEGAYSPVYMFCVVLVLIWVIVITNGPANFFLALCSFISERISYWQIIEYCDSRLSLIFICDVVLVHTDSSVINTDNTALISFLCFAFPRHDDCWALSEECEVSFPLSFIFRVASMYTSVSAASTGHWSFISHPALLTLWLYLY